MKYTPEQLQEMAQHAIQARDAGDPNYLMLVVETSLATGVNPNECNQRIEAMAAGTYKESE